MKQKEDTIHIFWTGGLDSTFRITHSLLNSDKLIQPHYIVRHEDSTGIEIDTMIQIRRYIVNKYPEVRNRFLPTIYTNEDFIPKDQEIEETVNELKKVSKVREQYQILANYCKEFKIEKVQLSLVKSTGEMAFIENFSDSPIFAPFEYPNKDLTKRDLYEIAKKENWEDVLLKTSFCRRPVKKIKPCGMCGPCADSVINGMAFRLPLVPRIKARIQIPFRKYYRNNYHKQDSNKFLKYVKKKYEGKF